MVKTNVKHRYSATRFLLFGICTLFLIAVSFKSKGQSWILKFDSSQPESYIDCGNFDEYSTAEFAIETWLYVDNWSGNYIMANESWSEASGSVGFAFRFNSNGQLEMSIGTGDWEAVKSPESSIKLKQWQHVAVSVSTDNNVNLYIDGVPVKEGVLSGPMLRSTAKLFMGEGSLWKGRRLEGKLADFRIWNTARTSDEINANKDIQLTGNESGLAANWLLSDGEGDVVLDLTGQHNLIRGAGTSWVLKNFVVVEGSLKVLNSGRDSVLVSVPGELISDWQVTTAAIGGEFTFTNRDDHSAYLVYESQTTSYQNDTITIAAVTADATEIHAMVAVDLYDNKYQYYGEKLLDQIHKEFYNKSNGLYAEAIDASSQFVQGTSFVWPASHMLRALVNAWKVNPEKYESMFSNYLEAVEQYKTTKAGRTGFAVLPGNNGERFYDDNGQLMMPFCHIYDLAQDQTTLGNLKIAYEFNNGIRDSRYAIPQHENQLGFGMLFSMSVNYTSYAAAKLYQVTSDTRYLDEALAYYETENDYAVKIKDATTKLFNQASYYQNGSWSLDGIVNGSTQRGGGYRAYQTTVVIQNAILLYQITKEEKYLNDAHEMMTSCLDRWYTPGQGLSEISFWGGDDMIDALLDMYQETADQEFFTIAADIMDFLSANNRDKRGYYAGSYEDSKGKWNLHRTSLNPAEVGMMGQAAAASSFLNVAFNSENTPTAVSKLESKKTKLAVPVFPNPASRGSELRIQLSEKAGQVCKVSIYSKSGQMIQLFESRRVAGDGLITFSPAINIPGIYFIRITSESKSYQAKVLIN